MKEGKIEEESQVLEELKEEESFSFRGRTTIQGNSIRKLKRAEIQGKLQAIKKKKIQRKKKGKERESSFRGAPTKNVQIAILQFSKSWAHLLFLFLLMPKTLTLIFLYLNLFLISKIHHLFLILHLLMQKLMLLLISKTNLILLLLRKLTMFSDRNYQTYLSPITSLSTLTDSKISLNSAISHVSSLVPPTKYLHILRLISFHAKFAAGLSKLRIKKSDVVMILLQNSFEFVTSFFAVSMTRRCCHHCKPLLHSGEIPSWKSHGIVELVESGQKQGEMIFVISQGKLTVKLSNDTEMSQEITVETAGNLKIDLDRTELPSSGEYSTAAVEAAGNLKIDSDWIEVPSSGEDSTAR